MSASRRDIVARLIALGAVMNAGKRVLLGQQPAPVGARIQHDSAEPYLPVVTPDLVRLPHRLVDGVKEFNLVAEVVHSRFVAERPITAWGYNGSIPGPTIEVQEGERVRIIFDNHLPEPTTPHWHGLEVPIEMDGVPGVTQDPIMPGGRFVYEFTVEQNGTFFYHSHMPMQQMMGMIGLFIIHPKRPFEPRVDRDFAFVLQEWALLPNNNVPNTLAMEFNWLTMNGKAGPATTPLLVKQGERVRIRIVNLGMDHHPIHLHGAQFVVTGTEGGRQPETTWGPGNTVIVGVAQARDIEFLAKATGDWMLHCHMPHHNMNQMASMVGPVVSMGHGLQTGAGMQEGAGIVRRGYALSEELGPSLGRGLGVAADSERMTSNAVGPQANLATTPSTERTSLQSAQHASHATPENALTAMYPKDDPDKKKVLGYPQDMWMVMDRMYESKPETQGLRPGWTGGMMGMMTLVRVLTPERYDQILAMMPTESRRPAQAAKRLGIAFKGRVQAVSDGTGRLTIKHENIEGWMAAMTMAYPVEKPEVLKSIRAGDEVSATVYVGDLTLYNITVLRTGDRREDK